MAGIGCHLRSSKLWRLSCLRGEQWNGKQNTCFKTKIIFLRIFFKFQSFCSVKNTFAINETDILLKIDWWHYKLQYLFCSALYDQWKDKKCAAPLSHYAECRKAFKKRKRREEGGRRNCKKKTNLNTRRMRKHPQILEQSGPINQKVVFLITMVN